MLRANNNYLNGRNKLSHMIEEFEKYLSKVKKPNGDKLLPITIEKYVYFVETYIKKFEGLQGKELLEEMNDILKQRNNIVIYSAFKSYLTFTGVDRDDELMRKVIKPEKSATAMSSVRFLQSKILSKQELKRLFNEVDDEKRLIFSFLYDTACRRNELLNIKFGDIEFVDKKKDNTNIYGKINILGKGAKSRTVYIGKISYDLLMKLRPNMLKEDKIFEFRDSKGNLCIKQDDKLYRLVKNTIQEVLGRNMSVHSWRHTKLSHLASAGSDVLGISKYAGHTNTNTSLIYIHTSDRVGRVTFENFSENIIEEKGYD